LREAQIIIESFGDATTTRSAPRLNLIPATSTRGVRARIRRMAGCATPTGSAGQAGGPATWSKDGEQSS